MKQVLPIELKEQDTILAEEMSKLLHHLESFIKDEMIIELMQKHTQTWTAINFVHKNIQMTIDYLND